MPYHLDLDNLELQYLEKRLTEEDLIPSLLPLRDNLAGNLKCLSAAGFKTPADLCAVLAKEKSLNAVSAAAGIPSGYLKLLGRALRGYTPKPVALGEYPGIGKQIVVKLEREGLNDSRAFWEAARGPKDRQRLAGKTGLTAHMLLEVACLADLSRIQWVSPLFARLLYDAGFKTVRQVALATAPDIFDRVDAVNRKKGLYKGKIGVRDMGRLVYLAALLPDELSV